MLKRTVMILPLFAIALAAGTAFAQAPDASKPAEPQKFYKLEFVVKEVEAGKLLNARSYSTTVAANGENASIRTGTKVPVQTGGASQMFQYVDVGVNLDCRAVKEAGGALVMLVAADVSSIPADSAATQATSTPASPMIRQNRWSSPVFVPLKQRTLLFSSDDLASKRQMQLEVTATPIP